MTHEIIVRFRHPRFVALAHQGEDLCDELMGKSFDWGFSKKPFLKTSFELNPEESHFSYSGKIEVQLDSFEIPSFPKETVSHVTSINLPSGWISLPTIIVKVKLEIEEISPVVLRTLDWFSILGNEIQFGGIEGIWSVFADELDNIDRGTFQKDIFSQILKQEHRVRVLARLKDEGWEYDLHEFKTTSDQSAYIQFILGAVFSLIIQQIEEDYSEINDIIRTIQQEIPKLEKSSPQFVPDRELRRRRYLRVLGALNQFTDGKKQMPTGVDPEAVRQFAYDVFSIIMKHWNKVIRYLKYQEYQHWLEEYPQYKRELFFIENEIILDSKPIIPFGMAHFLLALNKLESTYITHEKWDMMSSILNNQELSDQLDSKLTSGAIFSQSLEQLSKGELASAILLASAGLETAMTDALWHLEGDVFEKLERNRGFVDKFWLLYKQTTAKKLGFTIQEWKGLPDLINQGNKESGTGLNDVRKRLQHPIPGKPKSIPERHHVAKVILAAMNFANGLIKWISYQN